MNEVLWVSCVAGVGIPRVIFTGRWSELNACIVSSSMYCCQLCVRQMSIVVPLYGGAVL